MVGQVSAVRREIALGDGVEDVVVAGIHDGVAEDEDRRHNWRHRCPVGVTGLREVKLEEQKTGDEDSVDHHCHTYDDDTCGRRLIN